MLLYCYMDTDAKRTHKQEWFIVNPIEDWYGETFHSSQHWKEEAVSLD